MDIPTNDEYTRSDLNLVHVQTNSSYAVSKSELSKLSVKMDDSNKVFL